MITHVRTYHLTPQVQWVDIQGSEATYRTEIRVQASDPQASFEAGVIPYQFPAQEKVPEMTSSAQGLWEETVERRRPQPSPLLLGLRSAQPTEVTVYLTITPLAPLPEEETSMGWGGWLLVGVIGAAAAGGALMGASSFVSGTSPFTKSPGASILPKPTPSLLQQFRHLNP